MVVPTSFAFSLAKMVWTILRGWIFACITIASEIARAFRMGDVTPFHVG